jgi:predicted transcriptional regulator
MVVYPMRIEVDSLAAVRRIAKKLDRTNQYVLREAVRFYLAKKSKEAR